MEISVYTEGPYGGHRATFQQLFVAETIICLVGGIGITNALGFVQEYMSANLQRGESLGKRHGIMKKAKRFVLAWSAKEMALIEHVKQNFLVQKKTMLKGLNIHSGAQAFPTLPRESWTPLMMKAKRPKD